MTTKYIRRAKHSADQPYFLMLRETAQDRGISFEARGMLAYILSKPDDWRVQPKDLEQCCARQKVYSILKELKSAGYIVQEQKQGKDGRFAAGDYIVFEKPCADLPYTVQPYTVNQHVTEYRDSQSTEPQSKEEIPVAPNGAAAVHSSPEQFNINNVFDCVAWTAFGIKDMRKLRDDKNPAGARIGKIRAWLLKHHKDMDEAQIAAKVRDFKQSWKDRRSYTIPRDDGKFATEWLAWEQEKLPAPDAAPKRVIVVQRKDV